MSAAEALREAEEQLEKAKYAAEVARNWFSRDPSLKNEEELEERERHIRRAERFRDARKVAAEWERQAKEQEQRKQAKAKRAEFLGERGTLMTQVRERLDAVKALYEQLNEVVSTIDALVRQDAELCARHNDLCDVAGDKTRATPMQTEGLRLLVNAELGATWDDRPALRGDVELLDAFKAAQALEEPGSSADFYVRLERLVAETDHAFGAAPLARWLATLREPAWNDHSRAAERARHAIKLSKLRGNGQSE